MFFLHDKKTVKSTKIFVSITFKFFYAYKNLMQYLFFNIFLNAYISNWMKPGNQVLFNIFFALFSLVSKILFRDENF